MNLPADLEYIDVEDGKEVSPDLLAFFGNVNLEILAYHRDYRHHHNSDFVFIRTWRLTACVMAGLVLRRHKANVKSFRR
jgi:hypothetical protein